MPKLHYWLTGVFVLLLPVVCYATRLRLEIPSYLAGFLFSWAVQSIIWAGLLYQFGVDGAWAAVREKWQRFLVAAGLPLLILPLFGLHLNALLICAAGLVILEFYYRHGRWGAAASALAPWAYLALGIQLAMVYNCAIVSTRHFNLYDRMFERADAVLFGISVTKLSHAATMFYAPAEMIYYSIGGVMGAALLFLCLAGERRAAFQMAGTIVTAYFITLAIFWAWPSQGPYSLHATNFPAQMVTDQVQRTSLFNASVLYHHRVWVSPAAGYFVAFPSMHLAQPLIAGWFLRRWRRVAWFVFAYCALLVPAILVLQWHYLVDIVGGILVAALAAVLLRATHSIAKPVAMETAQSLDCATC